MSVGQILNLDTQHSVKSSYDQLKITRNQQFRNIAGDDQSVLCMELICLVNQLPAASKPSLSCFFQQGPLFNQGNGHVHDGSLRYHEEGCRPRSTMVNGLHLYSAFIQSAVQFMPLIHPFTHTFTHQRRLAAMQGTNQLVRSNQGLGVLLRDTSTRPGWDRTGNPPTARRQLYLLSHIATTPCRHPSFPNVVLSVKINVNVPLSVLFIFFLLSLLRAPAWSSSPSPQTSPSWPGDPA